MASSRTTMKHATTNRIFRFRIWLLSSHWRRFSCPVFFYRSFSIRRAMVSSALIRVVSSSDDESDPVWIAV